MWHAKQGENNATQSKWISRIPTSDKAMHHSQVGLQTPYV